VLEHLADREHLKLSSAIFSKQVIMHTGDQKPQVYFYGCHRLACITCCLL